MPATPPSSRPYVLAGSAAIALWAVAGLLVVLDATVGAIHLRSSLLLAALVVACTATVSAVMARLSFVAEQRALRRWARHEQYWRDYTRNHSRYSDEIMARLSALESPRRLPTARQAPTLEDELDTIAWKAHLADRWDRNRNAEEAGR